MKKTLGKRVAFARYLSKSLIKFFKLARPQKLMYFLPPIVVDATRHLLSEWEYMPEGWSSRDQHIKGWNEKSIVEAQKAHWKTLVRNLEGPGPLGVSHLPLCTSREDLESHNIVMCYAYVLTYAAMKKDSLTILDFGGGVGHYYLYSKALLPEMNFKYYCFDVPLLCKLGRELLPNVVFYENTDDILRRKYDLVLVSSSLHFFENWTEIIRKLVKVTGNFLYITRLHIANHNPSFVVVQRPYYHGYNTEYLSWFLNRQEFLKCVEGEGMKLIREFLFAEKFFIKGAPEHGESRGFLFHPSIQ